MTRIARKRRSAPAAKLITATASYGPPVKAPSAKATSVTPAAQAAQADFARQADGVNTARIIRNADGGITAESGFGNGAKKYSDEQIKWVMSRGASGGSLSRQDQAVYDRMMYLRAQQAAQEQQAAQDQKALDAAHAEDERRRRLDAEEWDRQNAVRQEQQQAAAKQAQEAQIDEEQRRNAEYDRRVKAEQDYKAQQRQAEIDAENAKYEALNRRHGIAEGTRLSEKDYNDLEAGRSKWGYSRADQQAIDKIRSDFDAAEKDNLYYKDRYFVKGKDGRLIPSQQGVDGADTEYNFARKEMEDNIASYRKRLLPNDQPLTAEQIYNGSIAAPDGTRLISNGSGALIAIPGTGPQKEVETPAEKNARVAQERKDKWLDAQIKLIMKEGTGKDSDGNTIPVSYQDAYDQAMEQMKIRFPSAPSVQTDQPSVDDETPQPATPIETQTNDPKKKWSQFAD